MRKRIYKNLQELCKALAIFILYLFDKLVQIANFNSAIV